MIIPGIVIILDIYPASQHALVGVGFWIIWAVGYTLVVPVVYFIREWRTLQFVVTLPSVLFAFTFIWSATIY